MTPITYQVVGEEDYALKIHIERDGAYVVDSGTYTTQPPRKGQLDEAQQQALVAALEDLGTPRSHPVPDEGGHAFEAHLTVGEPGQESDYAFWEGALEEDAPLNRLVRLIEQV
jgi:hypothetical protein